MDNCSNISQKLEDRPIPIQSDKRVFCFCFFYQCRVSILLCVDLMVTTLCVKHNLLVLLNWWVKNAGYAAQKWVVNCIQPKKRHQQKNGILNAFLM